MSKLNFKNWIWTVDHMRSQNLIASFQGWGSKTKALAIQCEPPEAVES